MRLLIADDHPLFLEAVKTQIERRKPGTEFLLAGALDEALRVARETGDVALILLDFSMPGMNGVAGIERVRRELPSVPIVVMSGTADHQTTIAAIQAGANGFLPKTLEPDVFVTALNVVLSGGTYLPTEIVSNLSPTAPTAAPPAAAEATGPRDLTPRELQVLQSIVNGKSNKEIARELDLQEVTIKLHARRIYAKLGARNRAEVTAIAMERKIVQRSAT